MVFDMTNKISKWKEGDDPQLVIDFINEVMNDLRPSYSENGWFTPEQEAEICKKYSPNNGPHHSFSFYDGKILHVEYKDVEISFLKMDMSFEFTFNNIFVGLYEDYHYYGGDTTYNKSRKEDRYNSFCPGFEDLLKIKGITDASITVVITQTEGEQDEHEDHTE